MGSEEDHGTLRSFLIEDIFNHPGKYRLELTKSVKKQLRLMKIPGTLPFFECIQAFSNLIKAPVYLYEELFGFVRYSPANAGDNVPCYIRSYDGVYFTILMPQSVDFNFDDFIQAPVTVTRTSKEPKALYQLERDAVDSGDPSVGVPCEGTLVPEVSFFKVRGTPSSPSGSSPSFNFLGPAGNTTQIVSKKPRGTKTVVFSNDKPKVHQYDPNEPLQSKGSVKNASSESPWRETFDPEAIREFQEKNRALRELRDCIIARDNCPIKDKFKCPHRNKHSKFGRHLDSIYLNSTGLLVKKLPLSHLMEPVFPYVVPFISACDLVRLAHINNAHVGRDKLFYLVQPYVFHPSLRHVVADVTRTCDHCQRAKTYRVSPTPPICKISSRKPFEKVHVDVLQLPSSTFGYKYVLNAVDQYSKWLASQPLKDKSSQSVCNAFSKVLSSFPSLPDTVISDNGGEFRGEPFRNLLSQYNVKHIFITPYSPQSNGLVERVNRTLLNTLHGLCPPNKWCSFLGRAVITYNNTYHKELQCTPSECLMGVVSKLPVHSGKKPFWKEGSKDFKPYALNSLVGFKDMTRSGVQKKLSNRYEGPYTVTQVNSNQKTYVIELKRDPSQQVKVHHNQLRPWYNAPAYLQRSSMFLSDVDGSGHEDPVEPMRELFPGLRSLYPSKPLDGQLDEDTSVSDGKFSPEIFPGLSDFKYLMVGPQIPFVPLPVPTPVTTSVSTPVTTSVTVSVSPISPPVTVAPMNLTFDLPVRRVSTPVVPRTDGLPVELPQMDVSPISPVGGSEPLLPILPVSSRLSQSLPDLSMPPEGYMESESSGFSGFGRSDSESGGNASIQFSDASLHLSNLPNESLLRSRRNSDSFGLSSSSLASMFSFREQSEHNHSPYEGFTGLHDLFEESLQLPLSSDTDHSSVRSDGSEYQPPGWGRLDHPDLDYRPRRVTRRMRSEAFPDLAVEDALDHLHS